MTQKRRGSGDLHVPSRVSPGWCHGDPIFPDVPDLGGCNPGTPGAVPGGQSFGVGNQSL